MPEPERKYVREKGLDKLISTAKEVEKSIAIGVKPAEVKRPTERKR